MKVSEIKTALARIDSDAGRRLSRLCSLFLDRYGDGPGSLLRAPARIDVLGEHIDYVSYLPTASLTFGSREHDVRSEEHTSELQSHSFISYAVFCLKKKTQSSYSPYACYFRFDGSIISGAGSH